MDQFITLQAETIKAAKKSKRQKIRIVAYSGGVIKIAHHGPMVIALNGLELPKSVTMLGPL